MQNTHDFMLAKDLVYLNHGSFGACTKLIFEEYIRWQKLLESNPTNFFARNFSDYMQACRRDLAGFLKVEPTTLALIPNSTFGVNVVANSLQLSAEDEVLITDHEYGACVRAWEHYTRNKGAKCKVVNLPWPLKSEDEVVEQIWKSVSKKTKLIFMSHITSRTAVVLPIRSLIERARKAGILVCIDGSHAPGQIDLNLEVDNFKI